MGVVKDGHGVHHLICSGILQVACNNLEEGRNPSGTWGHHTNRPSSRVNTWPPRCRRTCSGSQGAEWLGLRMPANIVTCLNKSSCVFSASLSKTLHVIRIGCSKNLLGLFDVNFLLQISLKLTERNQIFMFYGYQSSIIHAFINIHLDIYWFLWISMHGLSMDSRSRDFLFEKIGSFVGKSKNVRPVKCFDKDV